MACVDRHRWAELDPTQPLDVAVNVSAQQLSRADFAQTVMSIVSRAGTDPSALVLEMTETVLIEDSAHLIDVLGELRSLGLRLALDDFGTGYSSLSHLRRLPVTTVKIDRTFIADVGRDGRGRGGRHPRSPTSWGWTWSPKAWRPRLNRRT